MNAKRYGSLSAQLTPSWFSQIHHAAADFESHATALVRLHSSSVSPEPTRARSSKTGKYSAITLRVRFESRPQMDSLYAALTADERVVWAI